MFTAQLAVFTLFAESCLLHFLDIQVETQEGK